MVLRNYFVYISFLFVVSCNNSNKQFDSFVVKKYNICINKKDCIVNLQELPFKWDKFYIFSQDHLPQSTTSDEISYILGAKYHRNIGMDDRLLIFMNKGKISHEILTHYKKEKFIDLKPLPVDFYIDKNVPLYFNQNNANFLIKKTEDNYELFWHDNAYSDISK